MSGQRGSEGNGTEEPTGEEADLLARSTKKAKMHEAELSQPETIIEETPLDVNMEGEKRRVETQLKIQTVTEMAMKRKMVSYADVCLGINGYLKDDDSSDDDLFGLESMDDDSSSEEEVNEEHMSRWRRILCAQ